MPLPIGAAVLYCCHSTAPAHFASFCENYSAQDQIRGAATRNACMSSFVLPFCGSMGEW